jgi:hypothetical protein
MAQGSSLLSYLESVAFEERVRRAALRPQPFVTISRQAGAGGVAAAEALLAAMRTTLDPAMRDWRIMDREICEQVAADPNISVSIDSLMKETFRSEFQDYIMQFVADDSPQTAVVAKCFKVIRAAAAAGRVVVVGRAANLVTRRLPLGVHVRLVASEGWRQANMARRLGCSSAQAKDHIKELEASRKRLVSSFFHRDIEDPLLYDAVLNVESLGPAGVAAVVAELVRRKSAASVEPRPVS